MSKAELMQAMIEGALTWIPTEAVHPPDKRERLPRDADPPPLDEHGGVIPLGVARVIKQDRPTLACVGGDFYEFTGKVYEPVDPAALDRGAVEIIGGRARRSNLADIRHLLGVESHAPPGFFEGGEPGFIAVQNGMVEAESGCILPHDPRYRARNLLPVTFDPSAECPLFRRCLDEWLPDDPGARNLLMEWLGYCLLPDTRHEKALFLVGEGANGKGRFIRVQENLLGKANIAGLPLLSLRSDRTFMTAGLDGKLLNICPESELTAELDEGLIKSLISGDSIEVERKGRDPFTMRPVARFVIQSNNPPHLNDKSNGVWRRLIVVRFNRIFAEHEQDKELDAKLAAELPGIFNLALEGLHRLLDRGRFELTQTMRDDLNAYKRECNPLASWKDDCLMAAQPDYYGRPVWAPGDQVYKSYRDWCRDNGHVAYSRAKFTRELKRLGVEQGLTRNDSGKVIRAFMGVELCE